MQWEVSEAIKLEVLQKYDEFAITAFAILCFTEARTGMPAAGLVAVQLYPKRLDQSE